MVVRFDVHTECFVSLSLCRVSLRDCVQSDGTEVGPEALDGKVLAVYFSAGWCAPCKQFTPILKSVYNKLQEAGELSHECHGVAALCHHWELSCSVHAFRFSVVHDGSSNARRLPLNVTVQPLYR